MEGEFNTENATKIPAETLFNTLSTDENGLSSDEVSSRLEKYGSELGISGLHMVVCSGGVYSWRYFKNEIIQTSGRI